MRSTPAVRLPGSVYDKAAAAAADSSRTIPQQLAHWARIGFELEMSPQINRRAIAAVLAGEGAYDLLGQREQAVVREQWEQQIVSRRADLDYAADFAARGEAYSEADEDGQLVIIDPGPESTR